MFVDESSLGLPSQGIFLSFLNIFLVTFLLMGCFHLHDSFHLLFPLILVSISFLVVSLFLFYFFMTHRIYHKWPMVSLFTDLTLLAGSVWSWRCPCVCGGV